MKINNCKMIIINKITKIKFIQELNFLGKIAFIYFFQINYFLFLKIPEFSKKKNNEKTRFDFLDEIYKQGEERFFKQLSLERLLN